MESTATVLAPAPQPAADPAARPPALKRLLRRLDPLFLVSVFVPTLLAVAYFGFIASDVYISESRFVVRSPQRQSPTGLGGCTFECSFAA